MSNEKGKISVRQAMILIILYLCSPAIRFIPIYTTKAAQEAAWLAPFVAVIFLVIYILIWSKIIEKYNDKSLVDIIKDIFGKTLGTIIVIIFVLWITFYIGYGTRVYAERLLISAMPNVSIFILIGSLLLLVGYILKQGIVSLAKMAEIFFLLLALIFIIYNILVIPEMKINNLFPITYKDTFDIFKASLSMISLFGSIILIFFFNDKIDHKGEFKKIGIRTAILSASIFLMMIVVSVSVYGWKIISNMPVPYLNTMMSISLFDIIERVELGIVIFWIVSDFIMLSICIYSVLNILKIIFKLPSINPIINIYIVGLFFLSIIIAKSTSELQVYSEKILTPGNIILGYCFPIVILIIGKLRKKI
jgi:spore germination protein KB